MAQTIIKGRKSKKNELGLALRESKDIDLGIIDKKHPIFLNAPVEQLLGAPKDKPVDHAPFAFASYISTTWQA